MTRTNDDQPIVRASARKPSTGYFRDNRFRVLVVAENDAIRSSLLTLLSDTADAEIFYPKNEAEVVDLLRRPGEAVVLQDESSALPQTNRNSSEPAAALAWGAPPGGAVAVEGVRMTKLQAKVLKMVVSGCSNKEIAGLLNTTVPAAKRTIQHLFTKFGVRTRAQLAVIGSRAESRLEQLDALRLPTNLPVRPMN